MKLGRPPVRRSPPTVRGQVRFGSPGYAAKRSTDSCSIPLNPHTAAKLERHFYRHFGRLRDIVEGPDKALYVLASNHDGRGSPSPDDDRVIRLSLK
jgi:hypothetical protein